MKNPNGYGSVFKLSGNRRKPYTIRVTVNIKDGKQKYKYLSYHTTRKEATRELSEQGKSPLLKALFISLLEAPYLSLFSDLDSSI